MPSWSAMLVARRGTTRSSRLSEQLCHRLACTQIIHLWHGVATAVYVSIAATAMPQCEPTVLATAVRASMAALVLQRPLFRQPASPARQAGGVARCQAEANRRRRAEHRGSRLRGRSLRVLGGAAPASEVHRFVSSVLAGTQGSAQKILGGIGLCAGDDRAGVRVVEVAKTEGVVATRASCAACSNRRGVTPSCSPPR